jgi:hypothetical protein
MEPFHSEIAWEFVYQESEKRTPRFVDAHANLALKHNSISIEIGFDNRENIDQNYFNEYRKSSKTA